MRNFCLYFLFMLCAIHANAEDKGMHWQMNGENYRYDMTLYLLVQANEQTMINLENYEVAAFCGDECRGVMKQMSYKGVDFGYMRVYSNAKTGDTYQLKLYNKISEQEITLSHEGISFSEDALLGTPVEARVSSYSFQKGDTTGSGTIDLVDVETLRVLVLDAEMLYEGDMNSDGDLSIGDITRLINNLK